MNISTYTHLENLSGTDTCEPLVSLNGNQTSKLGTTILPSSGYLSENFKVAQTSFVIIDVLLNSKDVIDLKISFVSNQPTPMMNWISSDVID